MRSDMLGLKKHNESLQTENNRLRERENSVDSRIQTRLAA
jgi:FtsZ-binding cell division protein ZapB